MLGITGRTAQEQEANRWHGQHNDLHANQQDKQSSQSSPDGESDVQ